MTNPTAGDSESSRKSFVDQVTSFSVIYWLANWMELVERFAYYGVRVVLPVFMVATFEKGGFADRYGTSPVDGRLLGALDRFGADHKLLLS